MVRPGQPSGDLPATHQTTHDRDPHRRVDVGRAQHRRLAVGAASLTTGSSLTAAASLSGQPWAQSSATGKAPAFTS